MNVESLTLIPASEVVVGDMFFIEYAPSRETTVKVREVIDNEDGTFSFTLARFGLMGEYRDDEMVTVER